MTRAPSSALAGPAEPARSMGVDYGRRRIGLAVSDPSGVLASPLATLVRRRGKRAPVGRVLELARDRGVRRFVVGLPLAEDGGETPWTEETRAFGDRLARRSGLPVAFMDERYSSTAAEARIRSIGLKRKQREDKGRIDAAAAAVVLQDWLDERSRASADRGARGDREDESGS